MEEHFKGARIRDVVLGMQDGLVNVLGLALGVSGATNNPVIVIIAGLAATFAETISMAAVAYTSTKAEADYYQSEYDRESKEVKSMPAEEREEIRGIYYKKGFRGRVLDAIVKKITSDRKTWLDTMMHEELHLSPPRVNPLSSFMIVFGVTFLGSLIPLAPFFLVQRAMFYSLGISIAALFMLGVLKAKATTGKWLVDGAESALIGIAAAVVGYLIGVTISRLAAAPLTAL